jgi:predicted dehydrogenase
VKHKPDFQWSRREFCLAGAAQVLLGAEASERRIRVAVMGIGHAHAPSKVETLRAMPEFEFVGICEPDLGQSRERKPFQGVRWLSMKETLEDPSIQFVAVESRVQENLGYAQMAVEAGKFVHLDKAPGKDFDKLKKLLAEAARRQRVVQMGYDWRYHPGMRAAIEAARNGWLGDVYGLRATINKPISREERLQLAAFRGGIMFELGCHMIDRMVDLLGKPKQSIGFMRHDSRIQDGLADNTLAVFEYDRALAEIYVAAHQPNGGSYRTFEVLGTNGTATVRPFSPQRLEVDLREAAGPYRAGRQPVELPPEPGYRPSFQEMARIIRERATPLYSSEHDLTAHEALLTACQML